MADPKHAKKCGACGGSGKVKQKILDRKTGKVVIHTVTCGACGGSGRR